MSAMHPKATDTSLRTACREGPEQKRRSSYDDAASLFSSAHASPANSDSATVRHSTRIRPPTKLHGLPSPRSTRLPVSRRHQSTTPPQAIAPRD